MNREEAIKGLERVKTFFDGYKPNEEMFDMAIEALKAQEQTPCNERLPEEKGEYFITYTYGVDIAEYNPNMYGDSIWSRDNILFKHNSVTAWKSLPEPYKGGDTE